MQFLVYAIFPVHKSGIRQGSSVSTYCKFIKLVWIYALDANFPLCEFWPVSVDLRVSHI